MMEEQDDERMRSLQSRIVSRQLERRGDVYEDRLREDINDYSDKGRTSVTYIGNFFSFCKYGARSRGFIPFLKEMDYLHNYFLLEQMLLDTSFELETEYEASCFAVPSFTLFALIREASLDLAESGKPARIWVRSEEEGDEIKITVRYDIPYRCLADEEFRKENTYGFRLLQERVRLSCGCSLEREALEEGLMGCTFRLPKLQTEEQGPVFIWF